MVNTIDGLYLKSLQTPSYKSWSEALENEWHNLEFRVVPEGVLAGAEEHLRSALEPLPCDGCGGDVRRWQSQFWLDIAFPAPLGKVRWFRLCEICGLEAKEEDDKRILFMFRQWPISDDCWRNGFIQGYALEGEPCLRLNP